MDESKINIGNEPAMTLNQNNNNQETEKHNENRAHPQERTTSVLNDVEMDPSEDKERHVEEIAAEESHSIEDKSQVENSKDTAVTSDRKSDSIELKDQGDNNRKFQNMEPKRQTKDDEIQDPLLPVITHAPKVHKNGSNTGITAPAAESQSNSKAQGDSVAHTQHQQNAFSLLTPGRALFGDIPANEFTQSPRDSLSGQLTKIPPKFMRMTTTSLASSLSRPTTRERSIYYEEPRRQARAVAFSEATNSRPPLRIDMDGPTPCSYSPRNKPLGETNAPAYTFGVKCHPEKNGGGRTSWWKTWFQTPNVWLNKVDFFRDRSWPSPSLYCHNATVGAPQVSTPTAPAFTISGKKSSSVKFPGVVHGPSPSCYSRESADGVTLKRSASFTHGHRHGGTILWPSYEVTPGPGHYESSSVNQPTYPAFTIQGLRREKSYVLGPFSTF